MSKRGRNEVAVDSPLLSMEQVNQALEDGVADVGSWAGSLGGGLGGSAPGGRRGGGGGARLGARYAMKLDGAQRTLSVARTEETQGGLQAFLQDTSKSPMSEDYDREHDTERFVALVGVGIGGISPCVLQVTWTPSELRATAHALEGRLVKQHICRKALDALAAAVGEA